MSNAIQNLTTEATRAFAVACYDTNSIEELIDAGEPDAIDMKTWGIDESQWQAAIDTALNDRLHAWVLEYVEGCESNGVDPREAIAEKLNALIEEVEIDDEGDIHAGGWLDVQQLADLYRWHEATYA